MRLLIAVLALILIAVPAAAMSIKDFEAKATGDQTAYLAAFIDKMTTDIRQKNPELAQNIRAWFANKREGKTGSDGSEALYAELTALDLLAKDGKVDLSKIQIEGVVVKVVKDKFPPKR